MLFWLPRGLIELPGVGPTPISDLLGGHRLSRRTAALTSCARGHLPFAKEDATEMTIDTSWSEILPTHASAPEIFCGASGDLVDWLRQRCHEVHGEDGCAGIDFDARDADLRVAGQAALANPAILARYLDRSVSAEVAGNRAAGHSCDLFARTTRTTMPTELLSPGDQSQQGHADGHAIGHLAEVGRPRVLVHFCGNLIHAR